MPIKLFDEVELLRDSPEVPELIAGSRGVVVDVTENCLMVEFPDEIEVVALWRWDVRLIEWN